MLEAGATFVARGYPPKLDNLTDIIIQAVEHEGFSFVDVLQPCVSFNNTYDKYNALVEVLHTTHDKLEDALAIARKQDRLLVGVIYKIKKPVFHRELYQDWNPVLKRLSREERIDRMKKLISFG